ncbi:MAG: 50S ribosomal protein L17 [Bacteroidales bacterium]|nr:50S ribosomal protein L17 [Bacteroidales bacterium]
MRHLKSFNHLGRTSTHRKAMLSNMATSLILHKRITTTVAKAKALRGYVEPLITKSKQDTTHSRRIVFSYLQSKEAVTELFREVSPKIADRPGGYTRIIKTGNRLGDNADMCLIELVDFNKVYVSGDSAAAEKAAGRRRRRGSGKTKKEVAAVPVVEEAKAAQPEIVEEVQPVEDIVADTSPAEVEPAETPVAETIANAVEETEKAQPESEPEEKKPE